MELVEHGQELSWYFNLFVFFFETGCRCGESIGLTWSNVDFHKRFIKIDHQLIYELDENDERRFQMTDTKTIKSIRKIPLSMRALQALKMQKKQMQKAGLLENHTVDSHSGFVFLRRMDKLDAVRNISKDIGNDNNSKTFKVS